LALYEADAARIEADDYEPEDYDAPDSDDPDYPMDGDAFVARWIPTELIEAAKASRGRPSLSGKGTSRARQVRLPVDIDAALEARAKAEKRPMSALMRDAVTAYLHGGLVGVGK
jgi:hypothetical protein